jgi:ABC-2 type transport system ATP-binding protein
MTNAIEVISLTKVFDGLTAVDQINFQVRMGEFFGFLGPNGAGKTTTIRMLTGIINPSSGKISIMGYDIQKQTLQAKQMMGIVPEISNAYIDLSAWDNMMFQGELYGLPKNQRYEFSAKLLKDFGLYERRKQLVKFFSKGMKQRLIICLALLNHPEILFLDEPTVGLDVQSTTIIREKLRQINKNGTTIFLTTHNMEEANQLCERVAIINYGKIAAIDSPERLRLTIKGLQSVMVAFDRPVEPEFLSNLAGVSQIKKVGDKIQLYTVSPGRLICHIVDYARKESLSIITLNVLAPTLEDVFIKLTKGEKEK